VATDGWLHRSVVVAQRGSTDPIPSAMIETIGAKWRIVHAVMTWLTMYRTGTVTFEA
jgi:hypothetical protein